MNVVNQHSAEIDRIQSMVEQLLSSLDLEATIHTEVEPNQVYFNVEGTDIDMLLGHRQETPRSLATVLQHALDRWAPDSELTIKMDVNRTLRDQEDGLVQKAREAFEAVMAGEEEVVLGPFNPYERRLIHMALQAEEEVKTNSLGEGHLKRMVIRKVAVKESDSDAT